MNDIIPRFSLQCEASSLQTLSAILEQSHDCIKIIGINGSLDFINRNGQKAMQIDDFSTMAGQNWSDLWPQEAALAIREAIAKAQSGEATNFEAYCPTLKGEPRWWNVSVAPLKDGANAISAILSISRDISEQVRARQATEAIAREMRHRVRNAYALSAALARSLAHGDNVAENFASDLGIRLGHLGEAQNLLLDESAGGASLSELLSRLAVVYQGRDEMIVVGDIPVITLNERQAQGLALVVGELSTNSHKYGALKNGKPVRVSARLDGANLVTEWMEETRHASTPDTNMPDTNIPIESHMGGQGKELIRRFLVTMGGTIEYVWGEQDLAATISFPLSAR